MPTQQILRSFAMASLMKRGLLDTIPAVRWLGIRLMASMTCALEGCGGGGSQESVCRVDVGSASAGL